MGSLRSILDSELQTTVNQSQGNFHPSPLAWEDQLLYV
jgi:hypothetical protein